MHPEYHWCSILNKRLLIFEENYFFKIFDSFPIYSWSSNTLATWCEELIHWKRPWCWERLKAGGEGSNRGWDSWVEWHQQINGHEFEHTPRDGEGQGSLVCCSWWGRRVRHYWATEQQHTNSKESMPGSKSSLSCASGWWRQCTHIPESSLEL